MSDVVLALGSNYKRRYNLQLALSYLQSFVEISACSDVYVSRDVTGRGAGYFNIIVACKTSVPLDELAGKLKFVEFKQGRCAGSGVVPVDIDIVLYAKLGRKNFDLIHEDLSTKAHVLWPMFQLYPEGNHPHNGQSYCAMLSAHADKDFVLRLPSSATHILPAIHPLSSACVLDAFA